MAVQGQDSTPNTVAINIRIDSTLRLIHDNVRTGTITRAQAQTLLNQLNTTIQQFVSYLKTNNMADLTATQLSTMNGLFNTLTSGLTVFPTPTPVATPVPN